MVYPVRFEKRSALLLRSFCEHFGVCGGCTWQDVAYEQQLQFKHDLWLMPFAEPVRSWSCLLFHRLPARCTTGIIATNLNILFPTIVGLRPRRIDNKEELNRNALGFHIPGRFDKILDIRYCYLQPALPTRYAWQCGLMPCCVTSLSMICEPMKDTCATWSSETPPQEDL